MPSKSTLPSKPYLEEMKTTQFYRQATSCSPHQTTLQGTLRGVLHIEMEGHWLQHGNIQKYELHCRDV